MKPGLIPFSPLPLNKLLPLAHALKGLGANIVFLFPSLKEQLHQAELKIRLEEYGAIMLLIPSFYFVLFVVLIPLLLSLITENFLLLGLGVSLLLWFLIFIQIAFYPNILVKRKVRNIEKNLMFALRTMLVQIKGGVSLFRAMNLVAEGDHGQISVEFKKAIDKINTGLDQEEALRQLAADNPSNYFRKAIWQIVNGLVAGADIGDVLAESVRTMAREQKIAVKKYGSQLSLLSLVYMMIGVIMPTLGLTFLVVLSSFPKIVVTDFLFWILLGAVMVLEFMYIGIIKSRRPALMG